jgi:ABC-2 type transport system permease protein
VLPVAFIGYLPAAVLTGRAGSAGVLPWLAVGSPLVGLGLYVLARYVWFPGLRSYESAG